MTNALLRALLAGLHPMTSLESSLSALIYTCKTYLSSAIMDRPSVWPILKSSALKAHRNFRSCTNPGSLRSLGLAVPVVLLYAYSLSLQTYVLRLDVIVAAIGLAFVGFEGLLGVGTALSFYQAFRG